MTKNSILAMTHAILMEVLPNMKKESCIVRSDESHKSRGDMSYRVEGVDTGMLVTHGLSASTTYVLEALVSEVV